MAEFTKRSLTATGAEILADAHAGTQLKFTQIAAGEGYATGDLVDYTSLAAEVMRVPIISHMVMGNVFRADTNINETNLPRSFALRELGLYIADNDHPNDRNRDMLYAVTAVDPDSGGADFIVNLTKDSSEMVLGVRIGMFATIRPEAEITIELVPGQITIATQTTPGLVMGSSAPGNLNYRPNGTGYVNGWDELLARVTALES